jgi:hypothetical protein
MTVTNRRWALLNVVALGWGLLGSGCAVDASGSPSVAMTDDDCPNHALIFGESQGGFCCMSGALDPDGTSCQSKVCALDPEQSNGLALCDEVVHCNECPAVEDCIDGPWHDGAYTEEENVCLLEFGECVESCYWTG